MKVIDKETGREHNFRVEYKVRPVTRYIVTRYTVPAVGSPGSENLGEFQNVGLANRTAHGLAMSELVGPIEDPTEVYYQLYSHEYDETEYPNNGLIRAN